MGPLAHEKIGGVLLSGTLGDRLSRIGVGVVVSLVGLPWATGG